MIDRARVQEVYADAAALPGAERAAFLHAACGGDTLLRAEVESLLAAAARRPGFMDAPTVTPTAASAEAPGTRIGPYRVLQQIGEGGFGTVYMAEQEQPVRRRVALKIIKLGMDTRAVIARFDAERQALAMMDHANIAKVLGAGATEAGRPYFVMELVSGDPITAYCDRGNLSVAERLDLFLQVCQAVQHAHSKGVIHRDIKPSNVLVATQDGRPHAKVIDFGIAKATERRLTEKTLFTEFRQLVGTPEYMSPEQAGGSLDIDTRSDVYSLGVLLYELLTGSTPFDPTAMRSAAYAEIQRIIREVEPPKPSTRLSQSAALPDVAAHRRTEPARLSAMVRGDLDWIVMKALDKDRARRYETPSALASDIARHLAGEPVTAAPPSAAYRARKFVRRNRNLVAAGVVVASTLLLGVIGTTIGLVLTNAARANEQVQRKAAQAAQLRAETAESQARQRAEDLEQVATFQQSQLAHIDAHLMGQRLRADLLARTRAAAGRSNLSPDEINVRLVEVESLIAGADFTGIALDALNENVFQTAMAAIQKQFSDQPLVKARLLQAIADTMRTLGLLDAATGPQQEAMEIRTRMLGQDHPDTLDSIDSLADLLYAKGNLTEAETVLRGALEARRRAPELDQPGTFRTMDGLGVVLAAQGKLPESETLSRDALDGLRRTLGDDHPDTLTAINNAGHLLLAQGKRPEAEAALREAQERMRRVLGADHPDTLTAIHNTGFILFVQSKLPEAEEFLREALDGRRHVLGDQHPLTLTSMINLGLVFKTQGNLQSAEALFREAHQSGRLVLGDEHDTTIVARDHLRYILQSQGKLSDAEPYYRAELERCRRMYGDEALRTLILISETGSLLRDQGKPEDTIALLAPAEPAARRVLTGPYALSLARYLVTLGRARLALGRYDAAESSLMESHEIVNAFAVPNPAIRNDVFAGLAQLYETRHRESPGQGYDRQAGEWRQKLEALRPASTGKP